MLRALYKRLSSTIDPQSIARHLFQCNALTLKELQTIQDKENKPIKAAEMLINIVMNQSSNVYGLFLDALKKTGRQDMFEALVSDSCKGNHVTVEIIAYSYTVKCIVYADLSSICSSFKINWLIFH